MTSNYILKQAVITAVTLLSIGAQNNAYALGLGNIEVRSHLGQPLRATIKVQGASEIKSDACFKVVNDASAENQLSSANLKLSKTVDDVAILTVTTNQIINEPIVNLSVMAECDANMRRDYVLLLDPPLAADNDTAVEDTPVIADEKPAKSVDKPTKAAAQPQTIRTHAASTNKTSANKHKSNKKDNKNIVLTTGFNTEKSKESASGSAANAITSTPNTATSANKPHLSISSGDVTDVNINSAKLQLDKQLHFEPNTMPQTFATDVDTGDEVTVLTNRLAHLDKQINSLVQNNEKLKADNEVKTEALAKANALHNKLDWLGYILGGGLLLSSLTIADRMRRRYQSQQLQNAALSWESIHKSQNEPEDLGAAEEIDVNDSFFDDEEPRQEIAANVEKSTEVSDIPETTKEPVAPFSVEEFNSEHNVLDHADVFLSHGRTSLAIQLLQNHLLDFPKQSVTIWMFLLDLLAKENLQSVYEQTALECKEHFNVHIADFSKTDESINDSLESFPRITSGLQQLWGTPASVNYLDDLIYNSRLEIRVGFHKNVIEELILLKSVAQEELKSADIIQMDEKKLAMKELKEAQLAAKREEKLELLNEIALSEAEKKLEASKLETKEAMFEFNLVEFK
jgi:hypothetical protein